MKNIAPFASIINLLTLMIVITIAFAGCKEDDDYVPVSNISGAPTAAIAKSPLTLTATVSPSSASNQTITWSVKDAGTTGAIITSGNTLTTTATGTVIVTATIANGATKNTPYTKDFTITVSTNFTVTGVTISPETSEIPRGFSFEFKATVNGNNLTDAEKAVTWKVTGGSKTETAITADGTLTIAADETAETLTITATSTIDNSKSGTATIRVFEYKNFHEDSTEGAEAIEIEINNEKIKCHYVDGRYIIQGDIIIWDDNNVNNEINNRSKDVNLRAAMQAGATRWPEGKVYYFYDDINSEKALSSEVEKAMEIIQQVTHVKFIPLKTEKAKVYKNKERIVFVATKNENSAWVGMQSNLNNQVVNLNKSEPSALHEICHSLGLIHEMSRTDRDKYVIILYDNIIAGKEHNFEKHPMQYESNVFDFESVMMYDSWAFGKLNSFGLKATYKTITKLDDSPFECQRERLTSYDMRTINDMYQERNATADAFIHTNNVVPTNNSCVLKGELIYEGVPAVTTGNDEYGICYREKNSNASYAHVRATSKDTDGVYTCQLTNLKPNTTYEAGAYVIQNGQTHYTMTPKVEFKTLQSTDYSSKYIDFGDEKYVRISTINGNGEYLFEDGSSSASYNSKGITYLGVYNMFQYPNIKNVFKLKKIGVSGEKTLYTIYSEGEGNGLGGGGYLTDATNLAFNSNRTPKNPDYIWMTDWARLSFEKTQSNNSSFAFLRAENGSSDFVIETASSNSNTRDYIRFYNGVAIIARLSDGNFPSGAAIFNLIEVQR